MFWSNARVCGTPRMTKLLARLPNPSGFSRINPSLRMSTGFSKLFARAGINSATKIGSFGGRSSMNSASMVRLPFSR